MLARLLLLCSVLAFTSDPLLADDHRLTVSAAISLKPALLAIQPQYEKATGDAVTFNFGASGALLSQIKAGAPVDLFIAAAAKQVDDLVAAGLGDAATRTVVARGRLALVVPGKDKTAAASLADLGTDAVQRLAVGQPKTVPAGDYAAQALAKAGLSVAVAGKLVYGANVRQVLDYVARGEVDAGLVYATDAKDAGDAVTVVQLIDPSLHEPIVYSAVVVTDALHSAAAGRFLAYLRSDAGQRALADKGFDPATTPASPATAATVPTTMPSR